MIAATYVSTSQFTVLGDHTQLFEIGTALKCVQGIDGTLLAHVTGSSYSAGTGLTTVTVTPASLTANLTNVLVSYVSPSSLPNTVGGGGGGGLLSLDDSQRIIRSPLDHNVNAFALGNGTAYFIYMGKTSAILTPKRVKFYLAIVGSGTQTGNVEVGLFSTADPPKFPAANKVFTKLVATGALDDLTTGATSLKGNSSDFAVSIPEDTHVWAAIRCAMSGLPALNGLLYDCNLGFAYLTGTGAAPLTDAGPITASTYGAGGMLVRYPSLYLGLD